MLFPSRRKRLKGICLRVKPIKGELPLDPADPLWEKAVTIDVPLAGQVIARPRWENLSIDLVTVKALYNDKEIVFLLEWGDRFKDTVHKSELEYKVQATYEGYVSWEDLPRDIGNFRDSIALQFPIEIPKGTEKPHFFRGDAINPVNLWVWKSGMEEVGQPSIEDTNAMGPEQPLAVQKSQDVKGRGVWKEGYGGLL